MCAAIAFFVVFVLFIYIVLSNLIIGLAVNVTEKDLEASEYLRIVNGRITNQIRITFWPFLGCES